MAQKEIGQSKRVMKTYSLFTTGTTKNQQFAVERRFKMPFQYSNGTVMLNNGAFQATIGSLVQFVYTISSAGVASVNFTSSVDSTYAVYMFGLIKLYLFKAW